MSLLLTMLAGWLSAEVVRAWNNDLPLRAAIDVFFVFVALVAAHRLNEES